MRLAVVLPSYSSPTHTIGRDRLRECLQILGEHGFDATYFLEHLVRPATYRTAWMDPLISAAWALGASPGATVGTSVLLAPLRNPVLLTAQLLTLQHFSTGPLRLGVGSGYDATEFLAAGVPRNERGKRLDQFLETFDRATRTGAIELRGEDGTRTIIELGPRPHTPSVIRVGGGARSGSDASAGFPRVVVDRILRWGGWISSVRSYDQLAADWQMLQTTAVHAPLAHDHLNYTCLSTGSGETVHTQQRTAFEWLFGPDRGMTYATRNCFVGGLEEVADRIVRTSRLGVQVLSLHLVAPDHDDWCHQVRTLAEIRDQLDMGTHLLPPRD